MRSLWLFFSLLLLPVGLVPLGAAATAIHGDYTGTTRSFLGVQETTQTLGDPEPLFGAPTVIGDQLLFFPTQFTATSSNGVSDQTASLMEMVIRSDNGSPIDRIVIQEFGDVDLAGVGTAATSASVSLGGFITVLEILGQTVAPFVIPFTATYAPTDSYELPGAGYQLWTATADVDLTQFSGEPITKLRLSFNNILDATSEPGTTSLIQKKVVNGPAVVVTVPEPALALVLALGLLGAAGRRSRD